MKRLKQFILLFALFASAGKVFAKDTELTLSEAISKNLIKVTYVSNGQASNANALNIQIENVGKKGLNITIDPALIFVAKDTGYQDLLVAGNVTLNVQPAAIANAVLQTYGVENNASIPTKNLTYTLSKQADSNVIKLLNYTKLHNVNNELTQKAIWVFTHHKNVNTVYDPANDIVSKNLALYLAFTTKQSIPAYYKYFVLNAVDTTDTERQPATVAKPTQIFAFLKWTQKDDANISLVVADEKGKIIQPLFEQQMFKKGNYEMTAKFESAEVESGNYVIKLMQGNTMLKEIKVDVD